MSKIVKAVQLAPGPTAAAREAPASEKPLARSGGGPSRAAAIVEAAAILQAARARAAALIEAAHERSLKMVADAEARAEALRADAVTQGLEEGRLQGAEAARTEAARSVREDAKASLAQLAEALEAAAQARASLLKSGEEELVALACTIAEKMVRAHVEVDPDLVRRLLDELVARVGSGAVQLKVHPNDAVRLQGWTADPGAGIDSVKIVSDPGVEEGGVLLETEWGAFDARVGVRWERVRHVLEEAARNRD